MSDNIIAFPPVSVRSCPECDVQAARKGMQRQQFEFGSGDAQVVLSADVPVWTCSSCGYQFTDGEAEELRHAAVCQHVGLMSPAEIVAMRHRIGLTQRELAELTKLGEASIKRWESGSILQNASANMLLRLCENPTSRIVMERIAKETKGERSQPTFRTSLSDSQRHEAQVFQLRRMG